MSKTEDYYDKCNEHKRVKSEIASAYLFPWANIIGPHAKDIYYLDLFSGRGKFLDGSAATPLLILDQIQASSGQIPWILEKLHVSFYEGNRKYFDVLESTLKSHPVYSRLRHQPIIELKNIDSNFIGEVLRDIKLGTYSFIDPFGYNISLDLIDAVSSNWGCDCLFYLSISGLVRNIQEPEKEGSVKKFFGEDGFKRLIETIEKSPDSDSLSSMILSEIKESLKIRRKNYRVMKYCIEFDKKRRESHYLMFISKNELGIKIMRDIMLKRATTDNQGFPFLGLSPKMKLEESQTELSLGFPSDILETFSKKLSSDFNGKEMSLEVLLETCLEREYPLSDAHLRKIIGFLEQKGKVGVSRFDSNGRERLDKKFQKYDIIKFLN